MRLLVVTGFTAIDLMGTDVPSCKRMLLFSGLLCQLSADLFFLLDLFFVEV